MTKLWGLFWFQYLFGSARVCDVEILKIKKVILSKRSTPFLDQILKIVFLFYKIFVFEPMLRRVLTVEAECILMFRLMGER